MHSVKEFTKKIIKLSSYSYLDNDEQLKEEIIKFCFSI
jgi:hypothetical protein